MGHFEAKSGELTIEPIEHQTRVSFVSLAVNGNDGVLGDLAGGVDAAGAHDGWMHETKVFASFCSCARRHLQFEADAKVQLILKLLQEVSC